MFSILRSSKTKTKAAFSILKQLTTQNSLTNTILGFPFSQQQQKATSSSFSSSSSSSPYDHIRANVNCPRCEHQMPLLFSNRPLSITAREPNGVYQALNLCPNCKTAFYFKPFKLEPLQGSFIEIGRVKSDSVDSDGNSEKRLGSFGKPKFCKEKEAEEEDDDETASCLGKKDLPTPKEIVKLLDHFVVGQERAKKIVTVPDRGAQMNPRGDLIQMDTKNIIFICGGAFVDLEKKISERRQDSSIGFGAPVRANMRTGGSTYAAVTSSLLESVLTSTRRCSA